MKSTPPTKLIAPLLSAVILMTGAGRSIAQTPAVEKPTAANTHDPGEMWKSMYGASHEQRMQWWREARFGMFIHWGVYSVPAGTYHGEQSKHIGEWLMRDYNIPVAEYAG